MKSKIFLSLMLLIVFMFLCVADTAAQYINEIAYSPDGTRLAVANSIGIWIYDAQTGEDLKILTRHTNWVNSVSFSPDGQTLASGSDDDIIRLWDVSTGDPIRTLTGHTFDVLSVSFSPDGRTLASGGGDETIRLWDVATGDPIRTLTGHRLWVNSVSFSPDGHTLASGGGDETIRLWDVSTGDLLRTLTGHTWSVNSVSFSPDGQTLASGSEDNTIRLWDVATGASIHTLAGHTYPVTSVSFSPDGQTLASGSRDNTIRLWDVATGASIYTLAGHTSDVLSVSFSPDGQTLASRSAGNTVMLWDMGLFTADVNGDSVVNIQDLVLVASRFGEIGENETDVNADGVVNIQDLVLVAGAFGKDAAAPPAYKNRAIGLEPVVEGVPDIKPPNITLSTPQNGEIDVDPAQVFEDGVLVTFDETVTGDLRLMQGGEDVGWLTYIYGNTATLEPLAGQELNYETEYEVVGTVRDAAGNKSEVSIAFVTTSPPPMVAEENLVAYWPFENNQVRDHSGNGHDGNIMNHVEWVRGGFGDSALSVSGVGGYVVVSNYSTFGIEENFTLMGWFYPVGAVTDGLFILKVDTFRMDFNDNKELRFVVQPNDTSVKSVSRFQTSEWRHFAVTYDGKTMKMYIDGKLESEQHNDIPIVGSKTDFVIGYGFNGLIDELRIYNKALNTTEIQAIMIP